MAKWLGILALRIDLSELSTAKWSRVLDLMDEVIAGAQSPVTQTEC